MESFVCPIDLNFFVDPVTAPCGHTLCRDCYTGWMARAGAGGQVCPTCRAPLPHEPPAVNISLRNAQTAAEQRRPAPVLAAIAENDLVVDSTPEGVLGEGGFGIVRRGTWLGAPVAVKSLQRDAAEMGDAPARAFEKEMQVLARLRHPNVVPVSFSRVSAAELPSPPPASPFHARPHALTVLLLQQTPPTPGFWRVPPC